MKILVCVKIVPATTQVELDGHFRLKRDGANMQLNISDLSALEAALRMKAESPDSEVTVLSMGPAKAESILQELFPLGADRIVLLCDSALSGSDSLATARALAATVSHLGSFDCILCGRRALDAETGQIPAQLAAALNIPAVTNVESLSYADDTLECERRLENGICKIAAFFPVVVSLCEYVYTLRLPSILGRRRALGKQVEFLSAADIGFASDRIGLKGSATKVVHVDTKAPGLRKCRYPDSSDIIGVIKEAGL